MAITFQETKEKQKSLSLVFLIIVLIIFLVIYLGYFKKQKVPELSPPISPPPRIQINFEALENPFLKELLPFEEIKPFEGKIGRENPFLPYLPVSPPPAPPPR